MWKPSLIISEEIKIGVKMSGFTPVFRNVMILFMLLLNFGQAFSQEENASFDFEGKSLNTAVQEVVEKFDFLISYDPRILADEPVVTIKISQKNMRESLNILLGKRFEFKIIEDYVVITKSKLEPTKQIPTRKKQYYDTIIIEEHRTLYDTQRIELKTIVYDTVKIEQVVLVYDTVRSYIDTTQRQRKWKYKPFVAPHFWNRKQENSQDLLKGIKTGISVSYPVGKLNVEVGVNYNILLNNLSFDQTEIVNTLQVDTVSTFFIIEEGERIPVFVIDSNRISSERIRNIDRINSLQYLSLEIGAGYDLSLKSIKVGINVGLTFDWILKQNEILLLPNDQNTTILNSPEYRKPLINFQLQFPIDLKESTASDGYYLSPYFQYGLNQGFIDDRLQVNRYLFGVRFGYLF